MKIKFCKINKLFIVISCVILIAIIILFSLFIFYQNRNIALNLRIEDAISGSRVWDAEITFQNKIINAFYQSNSRGRTYSFSNLEKGEYELQIEAPYYQTIKQTIHLKNGVNVIQEPIKMHGVEIDDLSEFEMIWHKNLKSKQFILQAVDSKGNYIKNHPCLDIRVLSLITVQDDSHKNLEILYGGLVPWTWMDDLQDIYGYVVTLPDSVMIADSDSYISIVTLIIVPGIEQVYSGEIYEIYNKISSMDTVEEVESLLQNKSLNISHYVTSTVKNIEELF